MLQFSRRGLLAASGGAAAALALPLRANANAHVESLTATTRTIDVGGRAATVNGIFNARGSQGLVLEPGQRFRVDLTNDLRASTILHWHGQVPPNAQDGAPNTSPLVEPGATRSFDFETRPGTYWMHSHVAAHELELLAAPLIVRSAADVAADRQEVVLFLQDFSFLPAAQVLAAVTGMDGDMDDHGHDAPAAPAAGGMPGMAAMGGMAGMAGMAGMGEMGEMDLNDFEFDAYLANDRTLDDPEVVPVERNGRVLLRIINAASMTAFRIDLGSQQGRLVAVDGSAVQAVTASRFGIVQAQRLDIEIDIPGAVAVPVLAMREGARQQTGIVLAPAGATVTRIAGMSDQAHAPVSTDLGQEMMLRAANPLPVRAADRSHMLMLEGQMAPYVWTINGQGWGKHSPIPARSGERVEITMGNMSMMAHPMHLHGHVFQVVGLNGMRIAGAERDTVVVPPHGHVTIAFDAGEVAPWLFHCHHIAHMASGMMTEIAVTA